MTDKAVPFFFDSSKEVVIELSHGMTFGRNKDCDYTVIDHRVSGTHFKVSVKNGEAYIIDLESSNKTKINGDNVNPNIEIKLSKKDKIKFGEQQFYFFCESLEDFIIPELTSTLTISNTSDLVDDMIVPTDYYGNVGLSISDNNKKSTKLSDLKKSKSLLDEYEISLKTTLRNIERRDFLVSKYDSIVGKIKSSTDELEALSYLDKSKLREDRKSLSESIDELHCSIREAQQKIEQWKSDIVGLQSKVEENKRIDFIHTTLESDKEKEIAFLKEVESFRNMNLDDKKKELQETIKKEFDYYKELQESYSDSLTYKKSRIAS